MIGANEFCMAFKTTQQIGRLYLVVSSHARGDTFRIFLLPDGEQANPNGEDNPPLNNGAVEIYGVVSGHPGWTEVYGWIHHGKWQDTFNELYKERKAANEKAVIAAKKSIEAERNKKSLRTSGLLASY